MKNQNKKWISYLQLMFGTSLSNIYLFKKTSFGNFKFNFLEFNNWGISMQNTSCVVHLYYKPMVINFQQFWQISINFSLVLARPFANYGWKLCHSFLPPSTSPFLPQPIQTTKCKEGPLCFPTRPFLCANVAIGSWIPKPTWQSF